MRVERLSIRRVHVTLSCGCSVTCDFKDLQCKEPFRPDPESQPKGAAAVCESTKAACLSATKEYSICKKHEKDASRSILEFMMGERMDEAVEEARKQPETPKHLHPVPQPASLSGVVGESVQKVAAVAGAQNRPRRPPGIKQLKRTPPQVMEADPSAGAEADAMLKDGDVELGTGGSSSLDALIGGPAAAAPGGEAPSLDELLDGSDPTEDKRAVTQAED